MQSAFEYGDKIKLSTGEIGIFEEYNETDRKNVIRIRKSVCKYK